MHPLFPHECTVEVQDGVLVDWVSSTWRSTSAEGCECGIRMFIGSILIGTECSFENERLKTAKMLQGQ